MFIPLFLGLAMLFLPSLMAEEPAVAVGSAVVEPVTTETPTPESTPTPTEIPYVPPVTSVPTVAPSVVVPSAQPTSEPKSDQNCFSVNGGPVECHPRTDNKSETSVTVQGSSNENQSNNSNGSNVTVTEN